MNNKHDLKQQEQMAMIRAERAQRFAEQKAKKEASGLLGHLNSLNECFQRNPFPKDSSEDIYASAERATKYLTAVIELQHQINELINIWSSRESDLKPLGQAMSEQLGTTGKSCDLDASFEHDFVQFFKYVLLLQDHLNEVVSHINDRNVERRNQDKNIIVEVKIIQEHLQHILLQLSGKQFNDSEKKKSEPLVTAPVQSVEAVESDEDINQDNPFFALPNEMMMYILSQVPPQDLLNVRQMAKSKTALVDDTLKMITQPLYIIGFLSQADGITGHQFTAFYQKTQRYQDLKSKVLAQKFLTPEEAICYTLTRDCNELPVNLKEAMQEIELDEDTRKHLELIITTSANIRTFNRKLEKKSCLPRDELSELMRDKLNNLLVLLKPHPHQFVNLIVGANFSNLQLSGLDFSYLNLRGINFNDADLRGAHFIGACLSGANFNGALLQGVDFTDAELRGMQLNTTNFEDVDLSAMDLSGLDFEWAYIRNAKFLRADALNSPWKLITALHQFEQKIATHSSGSKRKLHERILMEIAHQLENSTRYSKREKITLLDIALSIIKPGDQIVGLFLFQNACQELKDKLSLGESQTHTPDHPLQTEAKEILERIEAILYGTDESLAGASLKTRHNAYKDQFTLLKQCILKYPELDNSIKLTQALGISAEMWHMLFISCPAIMLKHGLVTPIMAGYNLETQQPRASKRYASQVFDGFEFNIRALQQIKLKDLQQYLYEEEDFLILEANDRTNVRVKLGDLFITFCPGGKGSVISKVEVIDFAHKKLMPGFSVNLQRGRHIPFEAFMPLNPYLNYAAATVSPWNISVEDMPYIEEAYALKKQIIERIFTSEKINRYPKQAIFNSIFEQNENRQKSLMAELPMELVDRVCAHVYANTYTRRNNNSPLSEVYELHDKFFKDKTNRVQMTAQPRRVISTTPQAKRSTQRVVPSVPQVNALLPGGVSVMPQGRIPLPQIRSHIPKVKAPSQRVVSSTSEKGKEKEIVNQNQQTGLVKSSSPKSHGLFAETGKRVARKHIESRSTLPPKREVLGPRVSPAAQQNIAQVGTTALHATNEPKRTASNQGSRMFPAGEQSVPHSRVDEGQKKSAKNAHKPIAVDVTTSGSCLIS
ncbi:pentapeptide repeat-containing protein [Legionella sp. WA2024007413]